MDILYHVKPKPGINWSKIAPDINTSYSVTRERLAWSPLWNQYKLFILIPELDNYEFDKDGFDIIGGHRAPVITNQPKSSISPAINF